MLALFAKDWRLFRAPVVALIAVGAGCYLIALANILYPSADTDAPSSLFKASVVAFELTAVLASAFGGVAIAGERADRTADFLGLLPVSRLQIILSKWVVSILMIGACAAFHLIILGFCELIARPHFYSWNDGPRDIDGPATLILWIGFTTSLFGIAWLLSTFLRSGPISACISIATTIALFAIVAAPLDASNYSNQQFHFILASVFLGVGLLTTIGGAIYYVRRVAS